MTNMFKYRPGAPKGPFQGQKPDAGLDEKNQVDKVSGFCYLVGQDALVFGSDARYPRHNRPVVSVKRRDDLIYVLPGTTHQNPELFHLPRRLCLKPTNVPALDHDTYLFPYVELIPTSAMIQRLGNLKEPFLGALSEWLRKELKRQDSDVCRRQAS